MDWREASAKVTGKQNTDTHGKRNFTFIGTINGPESYFRANGVKSLDG